MSDEVLYFRTYEAAGDPDRTYEPTFLNVERDVPGLGVVPGLVLRPVFGTNLTMSFVYMEPNTEAPVHQHPEEQFGTIIEGSYEFELDGEKRVVRKGDVYMVPPNVPHGAWTHDEPCLALDVFSPPREMFRELMQKELERRAAAGESRDADSG